MKKGILPIFRLKNTVFTFDEIALILGETDSDKLGQKLAYYVKKGDVYRIRKGIYAKDKNYDKFEFAVKLYTPSYISLETVLAREGVIFQYYESIFVISYLARSVSCDGNAYVYKRMKNKSLVNSMGIEKKDNYYIATKERAFMDMLYYYKDYYFDNLDSIDWKRCFELVKIYDSKAVEKKLNSYYKEYARS